MVTLCNSCEQQESCKIFEIIGDGMPITHCKNYIQTRRETVRVKQTNADAIRQMTDDELYEFLLKVQIGDIDYSVAFCDMCKKDGGNELGLDCDGCFKHWLKQDAETHFQGLHTPCGLNSDVM